jgi:hypothetical protein
MKIIASCILTTIVYFVTFVLVGLIFTAIVHQPIDLARDSSGTVIGVCLIILPYIFNGFLSRKLFSNPIKGALITSLIIVIFERLVIYLIGLFFVLHGGERPTDNRSVLQFVQAEAAPFFTLPYILMGIVSVCISVFIASLKKPFFKKNINM